MRNLSRRRFLESAAAASALGTASPAFAAPAKLTDIDHIIILMKENRSFDHYFGSLRGVRGFDEGGAVFRQTDPENSDGYVLPFRLNTAATSDQRLHVLNHSWGIQHMAWNGGRMDKWIPAHRLADREFGPLTMGYMTRADIPYYYALADAFTICDGYFSSLMGPTHPNRYFLMTGTNDPDGRAGGPAIDNSGKGYRWETYPERLERAGVSWRVYHDTDDYNCNVCKYFTQYQGAPTTSPLYENAMRDRPFSALLADLKSGNIPQVSWIVPPGAVSEHPAYMPAAGEAHTAQVLDALWSNPALWAKTALILNYDENDGQFDHVTPPTAPPGTPGETVQGLPVGLGFRVPCIVVSPFSRGGYVCGHVFDHTSTLRLIEARFGVEIANLSRWRRATVGDLTAAFGFGAPPDPSVPAMPDAQRGLQLAQTEAATLPPPAVPAKQEMPRQEPGTRPRRA